MLQRGLDHHIAKVFFDPQIAIQHGFNRGLIMQHVAADEFQEIVKTTANQMNFNNFFKSL